MLSPDGSQPNGLAVVNVDPTSERYGQIVHQVIMPNTGGEFHYFGWKACYSACVTFLVFAYDRFWFFAPTGEGGDTNQHYRRKMRRWPGFRSDFVARFSPAGSTGCGRQMALQLGVNGQGHTDTSKHKANQFCRWQQGTGSTQVLRRCVGQAKITSDSEGGRRIRCRWAFTPRTHRIEFAL
jgi:hypothetical protein